MIHILKAFLLVSCVFVGFNIYASKSTYQYAHWVKDHDVCQHEYRIKWGY